ncbi:hypothetical protein ACQ4PT_003983 [Festuca glaucescens]
MVFGGTCVDLHLGNRGLIGSDSPRDRDLDLQFLGLPTINLQDLEVPFTMDETWAAVNDLPMVKAAGPDGFSGRFFQTAWDDVFRAIQHLYSLRAKGMRNLNDAFIILLPKKDGAIDVKDFRPISLIHSFGKLLSKILANCLAPRLSELVAENQSAFVKGRSIHDNFKMVQLTTRTLHLSRVPSMLVKIDITKAFDSVSWPFLLRVLRHFGFGDHFIEWICIILSTALSKLLLNSVPGRPILHRRGLR